jgi:hypothetical protein
VGYRCGESVSDRRGESVMGWSMGTSRTVVAESIRGVGGRREVVKAK